MRIVGSYLFYIELVKESPCSNKDQLAAKEHALARQIGATRNFFGQLSHKNKTNTQSAPKTPEHYDKSEEGKKETYKKSIPTTLLHTNFILAT